MCHLWRRPLTQRMPKQIRKATKCANCKGPHVAKGVQLIKKQVFRQHVVAWTTKKSYTSILKQNSVPPPQPKGDTFS